MTIVVYNGQKYRSIIHNGHVRLMIDGIDTNVSLKNCEEVYNIRFTLIRNNEDVQVSVKKLHQNGKMISVYTYNSEFARDNMLSLLGRGEYSGITDIKENDQFRVHKIDEKTKNVITSDYTIAEFILLYEKVFGQISTQ